MPTDQDLRISDVFARDGLQTMLHEPHLAEPSTDEKIEIVRALDAAGVPEIEVTGFVHPKVIPSLADAEAVLAGVMRDRPKAILRVLVPNVRGASRAIEAGAQKIKYVTVASETYQRLNANMSMEESLQEFERIVSMTAAEGITCSIGIGNSFVCPYEGVLGEAQLLELVSSIVDLGITDITLSDSVGLAWPSLVRSRCQAVIERWSDVRVGLHLHTLAGLALTNAFAAYEVGVRRFDGSVGGIGGGIAMPVHTTSMGNVATEDLVYMFGCCGIDTGIDLQALVRLARRVLDRVGTGGSHVVEFMTLDDFLDTNQRHLEALSAHAPGDSSKHGG